MVALVKRTTQLALIVFTLLGNAHAASNEVSFPYGGKFSISQEFKFLGSAPYPRALQTVDASFRMDKGSMVWDTYVLISDDTTEATEIVGVSVYTLPSRWYMKDHGLKPNRYYRLTIEKDEQIVEILKKSNKTPAKSYICGEFHIIVYDSGARSIAYCIASEKAGKQPDMQSHIASKFLERVHNLSSDAKYSNPTTTISERKVRQPTTIDDTGLTRGSAVAITFSRTLNTVFLGRSQQSGADAQEHTLTRCKANDCRSVYVTNENGCVSFAQDSSTRWGKARGANADEAQKKALDFCNTRSFNQDCTVTATICPQ